MTPPASLRDRPQLSLRVHRPSGSSHPEGPRLWWWAAAAGGGLLAVSVSWLVLAAAAVLGWLVAMAGPMSSVLLLATQFWFGVHGGTTALGGSNHWTVVPLGLVLVQLVVVAGIAHFAARQAPPEGSPLRWTLRVAGLLLGAYLLPLVTAQLLLGSPVELARVLVGGVLVAGVPALWGAARARRLPVRARWPWWLRPVPTAVGLGLAVAVGVGLVAFVTAVVLRLDQVRELSQAAAPGLVAGGVLLLAQLAYLPNLVLWSTSWTLGAGFGIGQGSVVTPVVTELGLLPGFPVLGALPPEGAGTGPQLLWLLGGVAAGATAGLWVVRCHPGARVDRSALVGGLAGCVTGLAVTVCAAFSGGDLGTGRLVEVGPRLPELAVMATVLLGLSGLVTGALAGLAGWLRGRLAGSDLSSRPDDEPRPADTVVLGPRDRVPRGGSGPGPGPAVGPGRRT